MGHRNAGTLAQLTSVPGRAGAGRLLANEELQLWNRAHTHTSWGPEPIVPPKESLGQDSWCGRIPAACGRALELKEENWVPVPTQVPTSWVNRRTSPSLSEQVFPSRETMERKSASRRAVRTTCQKACLPT